MKHVDIIYKQVENDFSGPTINPIAVIDHALIDIADEYMHTLRGAKSPVEFGINEIPVMDENDNRIDEVPLLETKEAVKDVIKRHYDKLNTRDKHYLSIWDKNGDHEMFAVCEDVLSLIYPLFTGEAYTPDELDENKLQDILKLFIEKRFESVSDTDSVEFLRMLKDEPSSELTKFLLKNAQYVQDSTDAYYATKSTD